MPNVQFTPIPGTEPGRTDSSLSNLITLALMYPEIRRKMREARELREIREGLTGQIDAARGAGAGATPGWLEGLGMPTAAAAPEAVPAAIANPLALPAGPEMGAGGLLTGLGGATGPGGMAGDKLLPYGLPLAGAAPEAAWPTAKPQGWLGLQTSAPAGPVAGGPDLNALPLANPAYGGGGLDKLFSTDAWRGPALKAAMLGESGWLGMKAQGYTPSRAEAEQAYQWDELGGKEQFTQRELTKRAQAAAQTKLQIAGDNLAAAGARAAAETRTKEAAQHYANAKSHSQDAVSYWRMLVEGGEPGLAERALDAEQKARDEKALGDSLEMNAAVRGPAAGTPASPQPTGGGPAAVTPKPGVTVQPGGRIGRRLAVTVRGQDLSAAAAGARLQVSREQLQLAQQRFAWARTHGGTEKAQAASEGLQAFFKVTPEQGNYLAALSPSLQIAALKKAGLIQPGDEKSVEGLTRTMMSKMDAPVGATPKEMKEFVNGVHGVASELITAWRPKAPAAGAGRRGRGKTRTSAKATRSGYDAAKSAVGY